MTKYLVLPMLVVGLLLAGSAQASTTTTEADRGTSSYSVAQVKKVTIKFRGKYKVRLRWNKVLGVDGYTTRVLTYKNKNVKRKKKTSRPGVTIKKLKANRKFIFRIKARNNGRTGQYSKSRTIKTRIEGWAKSINLTNAGNGAVSWEADYIADANPLGVKVVYSKTEKPTYPTRAGDKYKYISGTETTSTTLEAFNGSGTYYVRVCDYLGNGRCGTYSNQITVELTEVESNVKSITATAGESKVYWSVDGYSGKGFKVAYSRVNAFPTYPTAEGDKYNYVSDPNATYASLYGFDGAGTYNVRVCQYLGGSCGVYSNVVQVYLSDNSGKY